MPMPRATSATKSLQLYPRMLQVWLAARAWATMTLSFWYCAAVSGRAKRLAISRPRVSFSGVVVASTGIEHHAGEIAGWMDVCVGCGGGLAERVEAAVGDVAVTVGAVQRDTK